MPDQTEPISPEILDAIRRVLSGETNAYAIITAAYMDKLYRTALHLTGGRIHLAEDLVQETLIDGYLKLGSLREHEKIYPWLHRILKNKAINLALRTPRTEPEEAAWSLADRRSPENLYVAKETLKQWYDKLDRLSPALRETALLYFWSRLTMEQISDRLGVPIGTVKRRIHDAREQLKKENAMDNTNNIHLHDGFLDAVQKKVEELQNYHKVYGTMDGFDSAFRQAQELIENLSDKDEMKKYATQAMQIAIKADYKKYNSEAMELAKKYGEANMYSNSSLEICWALGSDEEKRKYTTETILPTLEDFPDSVEKACAIGYHKFWLAHYTDKSTDEGKDTADKLLAEALEGYKQSPKPDSMYGNVISAQKAMAFLRDERYVSPINVCLTGERWMLEDGNLYYKNQPGCNYSCDQSLADYDFPIFYYAGCSGDRYFFPKTIPLEAGAKEEMLDKNGRTVGIREVISLTETIAVPAGTFENCLHLRKTEADGAVFDIWYVQGVGLVKISGPMYDTSIRTEVLASYEIHGGEGYMPLAVGNTWRYERPDRPDVIHELNEYIVEQLDDAAVSLSCINFAGLVKDWENLTDDPRVLLTSVSNLCGNKDYPTAANMLRRIIMENRMAECTAFANGALVAMEEKIAYDKLGWRFCPSSINGSYATVKPDGKITYGETEFHSFVIGPWGSRGEENGIFGVKPFRYLQMGMQCLWNPSWVPGYTEETTDTDWDDKTWHQTLTVTGGETVEIPLGKFENCLHLTIDREVQGVERDYTHYFYSHTYCGHKEYWFAPGVGVVRFTCDWGGFVKTDCVLSDYHTVAKDGEYMPMYVGNRWRYDELGLTGEGYIARRDYSVAYGMNGRYLLVDNQMFTYRGNVEAYEEFKRQLAEKNP